VIPLAVCDPDVVREPDHAPEAVQLDAAVVDQVSVELPPLATLLGLALNETVGGVALTVTVAELLAEPPVPVQARLNWVVVLSATVDAEPLVDCAPVQPPDAVHAVAFVADQASVELLPLLTVEGLAEIVTVGADFVTDTVADCAADPPAPEQDRV